VATKVEFMAMVRLVAGKEVFEIFLNKTFCTKFSKINGISKKSKRLYSP
jgi:hypothetical protein